MKTLKNISNDACCLAGLAAITYAGRLVHPALGWLVIGLALFVYSVGSAMLAAKEKKS